MFCFFEFFFAPALFFSKDLYVKAWFANVGFLYARNFQKENNYPSLITNYYSLNLAIMPLLKERISPIYAKV